MPDIDRDEYGLVKVHIREYLGYVWACLADEPPSFKEDVMGAAEERLGDHQKIEGYDSATTPAPSSRPCS
jgi:Rieske 2Fe-2S family protein